MIDDVMYMKLKHGGYIFMKDQGKHCITRNMFKFTQPLLVSGVFGGREEDSL